MCQPEPCNKTMANLSNYTDYLGKLKISQYAMEVTYW